VSWIELDPDRFQEHFEGSPLRRPGREGLARNAALVLGNRASERGQRALLAALTFDPSAVVRGAAAWSLGRAHGAEAAARTALDRAHASDPDPDVRREAGAALGSR
jgi:epoxyqueuosine reductase